MRLGHVFLSLFFRKEKSKAYPKETTFHVQLAKSKIYLTEKENKKQYTNVIGDQNMIRENTSIQNLSKKSVAVLNSYGVYSSCEKTLGEVLEENGLDQHLVLRDLNSQKKSK